MGVGLSPIYFRCLQGLTIRTRKSAKSSPSLRVARFMPREAAMQAIWASMGSVAVPARSLRAKIGPYNSAASTSNGSM
jgi:hypothetical protein